MDVLFSSVNQSEYNVTDLYEVYREKEIYRLRSYKYVGFILGSIIILSNLPVVVSSGLILRKGMMVCPAMVSIFSVGLIAVDRYIYILHGLYYKRWFSTTRVRIGIVLIWMIGIVLGFMPATGWVSEELNMTRCFYVSLFPGPLILLNSFLSSIPIVVVVVLYAIILVKALQTVKTINGTIKIKEVTPVSEKPKLRINRGTMVDRRANQQTVKIDVKLKRSASFSLGATINTKLNCRSKSIEDLSGVDKFQIKKTRKSTGRFDSNFSVYTVESNASFNLPSIENDDYTEQRSFERKRHLKVRKIKEPNKWRAITVVLLTTGTFIITWIPFFIAVIFFVFCEEKLTNPKCIQLRFLLGGPFPLLAFTNSIVNPLIYAWWHKGFKNSVKTYYKRYFHFPKYFCHVIL